MSDLILINVTGRSVNAKYIPAQEPTAGWTGELQALFTFDASWAGASKTAVFTAGEVSVPVHLSDMTVEVPPEVLAVEGETLMVGVVGVWDENTTRPTEVVPVVDISRGAYIPAAWRPTTPELYTQLLAAVAGHVRTVDGITPDQYGNVDLPPFPFLCSIGGATCKNIYDAYGRGEFVYGVDNDGGIYPLIQRPSLTSAVFGGYNPVSKRATYWAAQSEDNETVWITGSEAWERSYVLNNSTKLATCKAVYDELTKYYDKTVVDNAIAAAKAEAAQALASHNADALAHPVIRQTITELANRLNALADSDDATLDQLSEIVAYIKSNKSLIDIVTTSKVSVSDIVNNLTSTATNRPLSAAQGAALKAAVDALEAEVEASKVIVLDADNLPENAYNVVAAAFPSQRLCCMRISSNDARYLFLQDAVYGEDYFTFSAVGCNGKLIKRKLFRDNTLSPSEISDLSNVFVGDDNTTYSEWRTHIDAGKACVWRSSDYLGFDYAYIGMVASGTLLFNAIEYTLALTLEISPSGTKSLRSYSIPSKPAPSEAGYVWTATATGTAKWAPPTGGSGGGGNTVVFDEATVTYDSVAAAVNAGKVVHLWRTDEDGERESLTLVLVPETVPGDPFNFVSGVINDNESESLIVRTAILHSTNELLFGVEHIASMDYVRQVVVDALPTLIQQSTDQVKLAIIMFSDNKLYLLDAAAETQIELTFDVLTQLVIARPTIVLDFTNGTVYTFNKAGLDGSSIVFSRTDGNTTSTITMAADNTVTVAESEITYTKDQIDAALGAYITDIDALIGGDS